MVKSRARIMVVRKKCRLLCKWCRLTCKGNFVAWTIVNRESPLSSHRQKSATQREWNCGWLRLYPVMKQSVVVDVLKIALNDHSLGTFYQPAYLRRSRGEEDHSVISTVINLLSFDWHRELNTSSWLYVTKSLTTYNKTSALNISLL